MRTQDSARIFLDMDGVLSDFIGGVARILSLPNNYVQLKFGNEIVPWNLEEIFSGYNIDEIMSKCDATFWAELDPYPWANYLVEFLVGLVGEENVIFCSCPGNYTKEKYYSIIQGKIHWLHKNFPDINCDIIFSCRKQLYANRKSILIDDNESQCQRFSDNDGIGILFPQLWNHKRHLYVSGQMLTSIKEDIMQALNWQTSTVTS